jgi:hypothetical protein
MTREPRTSPIIPAYGELSLADLSASLLASLGESAAAGSANVLGLPAARRVCLLIVDGMGWEQLRAHQAAAPFLSELAFNSRPMTCGFPSTTVTSLATLGTALVPGEHGMLGMQVAIPGEGRLLNGLHWPQDVDPVSWQAKPTIFERARAAGVGVFHVADGAYETTGLSRAALRGADFRPARPLGALAAEAVDALQDCEPVLVTVYAADLDVTGHQYGVSSPAWTYQLAHVDRLAEQIAAALPMGAVLYVTADHGMVNVGPDDRIDVDAVAQLREGVALLGGEPRARHVYAEPGAAADVLAAWREVLGDRAWVASRDEAIKDGWFGSVDEVMRDRIGDVVAAAAGTWALVASEAIPAEPPMIGMHGSLTSSEQLVPLLAYLSRLDGPGYRPGGRQGAVPPGGRYLPGGRRRHPDQRRRASDRAGGQSRAGCPRRPVDAERPAWPLAVRRRARPWRGLHRPGRGPRRPARGRRPAPDAVGGLLRGGDAPARGARRPARRRLRSRRLHGGGPRVVAAAVLRPPGRAGTRRRLPRVAGRWPARPGWREARQGGQGSGQ